METLLSPVTCPQAGAYLRADALKAKGRILALGFCRKAEGVEFVWHRKIYMPSVLIFAGVFQTSPRHWTPFQNEKYPHVFLGISLLHRGTDHTHVMSKGREHSS